MSAQLKATLEDLYNVPEKAELVNGEIIVVAAIGYLPGYAGGEIFANLREYAKVNKTGVAMPDNVGFAVHLPNRESFSPDAAFYIGRTAGMGFLEGAPAFANEGLDNAC
jgi:Uma2 family endonuclease